MRSRKAGRVIRNAKAAGTDEKVRKQIEHLYEAARDELRRMAKEGLVDGDVANRYHPVRTLVRIEHDPSIPPVIRAMAAKEILSYVEVPKSVQFKADSKNPEDFNITIQIASWASASTPAVPALPAPDETIVEPDMPRTNTTPAVPAMSERERMRAQVLAQRETIVVEVPVSPAEQPRVIGRMNQGHPYELSDEQKRNIMERLKGGPA